MEQLRNPHYLKAPDTGSRMAAALLDQVFAFILKVIAMLPFFYALSKMSSRGMIPKNPFLFFIETNFIISFISLSSFFYLKDVFNGRSPGKRIMGLQVINSLSGKTASPVQCALRGFGNILWPVEAIMTIANPQRRLGDFIAGTRLVEYAKTENIKFPFYQHLLAVLISISIGTCSYLPFYLLGSMATNSPISAPPPEYRTEEIKEKPAETENLTDFFKTRYANECESILLSSQAMEGQSGALVNGSFLLKKDLFANGEVYALRDRIEKDLKEKLSGQPHNVDVSIVYMGGEDPQQLKIRFSSGE